MILNNSTFENLIKESPSIEAVLEWDGTEGHSLINDFETETTSFFINTSLNVFESVNIDYGDNQTAPSFDSNGIIISDVYFDVFCKNSDEKAIFTEQQKETLTQHIITNLKITS